VRFVSHGRLDRVDAIIGMVVAEPGPRLVILNTVQSAAIVAKAFRARNLDVLHLSTALCPRDRALVLAKVERRLAAEDGGGDWTLVATSLMEAGVDVSFASCFRESFSLASLIQIGGRANRHGERRGAMVHDFFLTKVDGLTLHPDAEGGAEILRRLFKEGALDGDFDAAQLVTEAMKRELRSRSALRDHLSAAEAEKNYPDAESLGKIIDAQTQLVVVDQDLAERLSRREPVTTRELLAGSVQIWSPRIGDLGLKPIEGRRTGDIFLWPHTYDGDFLGYMEGALQLRAIAEGSALII
jgi:CRISPR-associated endonuclease/helicase Cas3